MSTSPPRHVFVYGTLRRGARAPIEKLTCGGVTFVGRASARGRLYDLGRFPGMTEPEDSGDWVHGELYELVDPVRALEDVDRYEGPEFVRRPSRARCGDGSEAEAWVYVYVGSVDEERRLPSGDYFARDQRRLRVRRRR